MITRGHPSERIDRIKPDFIIHNDWTIEQLQADLDAVLKKHFEDVQNTTFVGSTKHSKAALGLALASVSGL